VWDRGNLGGLTVKFLGAALVLHVMSRAQLRELMVLFVVGSALTLAVFFLALWLMPEQPFTPFLLPRFP
jgi:phage shock protein PspC (stress-responsive transcriptional regulator)